MRFHNSNGITWSDEKRMKEKLVKSSGCSDYYENENAMHALIGITLKFYLFTVLAYVTLSISFAVEALSLCFTRFCKHYARYNGKIKHRLVLSLEISRDRDKLLTLSVPSQFCCTVRFNPVSLMLEVIFFTL